ncbi:MAG: prepilin-type N-terminal cleavage/methylation domain-containing protein [Candidatus Gracilibacteria bacterium]|nr:prepilin-type N-terminal cleavage/methylation domain-containing protein [Candidatus Gracilibacteria bacterium]
MNKQKQGFTLVELIVVITILAILATIAFISLSGYSQDARNSSRASDVKTIEKSLQLYATRNSVYPTPENPQTVSYSGDTVYYQGTFGDSPYKEVGNLSNIPLDPLTKEEYIYSTTANYTQYEILAIYEGEIVNNTILNQAQAAETYKPKVNGTYNKIYVKTNKYYVPLPSIINAEVTSATGVVLDSNTIKSQIVTNGKNLPKVGATINQTTQNLTINFAPYYGTITSTSSDADKIDLAQKIQEAYSGSELQTQAIYENILSKTATEALVVLVDSVVLGKVSNIVTLNTNNNGLYISQIASSDSYTCALLNDGTVKCWGYNASGYLGDGTFDDSLIPVSVTGLTGVKQIATDFGGWHTCALLNDDTVKCWGEGMDGQLGNSTWDDDSNVPVLVTLLTGVKQVSVGNWHTCALLNDDTVKCWGSNPPGALGDGTLDNSNEPVLVTGLTGVKKISAGREFTCALLNDDTVKCWGGNYSGRFGNGNTANSLVPIDSGYTGALDIATGGWHLCVLMNDNTVKCSGDNASGQLGDNNSPTDSSIPVSVSGLTGVKKIGAGYYFSCALLNDGTVKCWGDNDSGQLGDGTTASSSTPVDVSGLTGVSDISVGGGYVCAELNDGTAKCWGENRYGQLGDGTINESHVPVSVQNIN